MPHELTKAGQCEESEANTAKIQIQWPTFFALAVYVYIDSRNMSINDSCRVPLSFVFLRFFCCFLKGGGHVSVTRLMIISFDAQKWQKCGSTEYRLSHAALGIIIIQINAQSRTNTLSIRSQALDKSSTIFIIHKFQTNALSFAHRFSILLAR